jgi:plasmid stabilization system protein ParE
MRIYWEDEASDDLEKIQEFLRTHFGKNFANKVIDKIFTKAELLEHFPEMGTIQQSFQDKELLPIRYLVESNYKILYQINAPKGLIEILAVFDTRQNPSKILSKEE